MKTNNTIFLSICSILAMIIMCGSLPADDKKDKKDDEKHGKKEKTMHKEEPKREEPRGSHASDHKDHGKPGPVVEKTESSSHGKVEKRSTYEPRTVHSSDQGSRVQGVSRVAQVDPKRRSHYTERHEHHSPQWYSTRGWEEDLGYWRTYHRHRYYNDIDGIVIIEPFGEGENTRYVRLDYDTSIAVQRALGRAGYYRGPIDGEIGPGTQLAISDYQRDHGLRATGTVDGPLLDSLQVR